MHLAKRLVYPALLLPLLSLLSCSEDFDVSAPYKPVTVVYGLLNVLDTAHYIRIQKAFLDESKSALDMAKAVDSNFYATLDVHLKELSNGSVIFDETLPRVDLNAEGFPKDTGTFFNAPSYAYKSKRPLNTAYTYRLVVRNTATGETDSATTPVITAEYPAFTVNNFDFLSPALSFPGLKQDDNYVINVDATPPGAKIFEGVMRFRYQSKFQSGAATLDSADFHFGTAIGSDNRASLSVNQGAIYDFLAKTIGPAPAGVSRYIGKVDIFIWAGAEEMATFQNRNGVGGGLTADQIRPIYSNIRGANALGLFSSRTYRVRRNVMIDDITIDSLKVKVATAPLAIKGRITP